MNLEAKLSAVLDRYSEITDTLSKTTDGNTIVKLSKEQSQLEDLVQVGKQWQRVCREIEQAQELIASADSPEMKDLAQEELLSQQAQKTELENKIKLLLLPKDSADDKNVILEVRAGTGGEEAALFAAELFRMYERYANFKGWTFEIISLCDTGIGGYKEAVAHICGRSVYATLKFESGVHRVQRVPVTETNGRVHTSAATVAVLPEADEIDMPIDIEKEIKMDTYHSSGAGGQHVNKTNSAVRLTHIPTGIVVECQEERSQFKNKDKALARLRAQLYERQRNAIESQQSAQRKSLVGSGDRSERIRTYNFPQGRVTDHRINLTLYQINDVMEGPGLEAFTKALITEDELSKLAELENA